MAQRVMPTANWWLAEFAGLFAEAPRADRIKYDLLLQIAASPAKPGLEAQNLTVVDRRQAEPRVYKLMGAPDELRQQLAAIRGVGRDEVRAKILIDPAACLIRALTLPAQVLPRLREVLAQDLEARTPFRSDMVYSDWYVESEDDDGHLKVRHVVLKRAALDSLLVTLAEAGLVAGPVAVGRAETQAMPVDLLTGGYRTIPGVLRRIKAGDAVLALIAVILAISAFGLFRAHQTATLDALDEATREARLTSLNRVPGPVLSGAASLEAARAARPPLGLVWATLAALPKAISIENLHISPSGVTVTVLTPDETTARDALAALPPFGLPRIVSIGETATQAKRVTLTIPWRAPS
jgi:general secretion pathway protein L